VAVTGPISPELVLVSPELAEQARAALPDRPWELFVPSPPAEVVPLAVPVAAPAHQPSRAARILAYSPGILLLAFVLVIAVGSLPWLGDRPSLEPAPTVTQPVPTTPTSPSAPPQPAKATPTATQGVRTADGTAGRAGLLDTLAASAPR
jgi:hypothetical protein